MNIINSVSSPLNPDVNLLPNNSIQEALAKGEVKSSRGVTSHEMQERWTSLIYEPVVLAEASGRVPSGFNPLLKISKLDDWKGNGKKSEKRKVGSVCGQYYRMRKRIKDGLVYSPDLSVFEKWSKSSTVTEGGYADYPDSVFNVLNEDDVCQREADDAFTSQSRLDSVQLNKGKVICTLNTEDSFIPCNDDIFLLIHSSPSFRPEIATDSTDPLTSRANEKDSRQGPSEENDPTLSSTPSQMDGTYLSSDLDSAHPHVGQTFKNESSDTKWVHPLDEVLGQDSVDTSTTYSEMSLRTEVGSLEMIDPESMDNNTSLSQNISDVDAAMPYFCDIEAMIFRLDLEHAQSSCITSEVARHQYNYSNRTIIRSECTARSLIRSMSSLGAFAIFYGRHFRYYIKKTEVTIGQSTDDTDVDINLRKEGHDNMLSSRQATIKVETDGSFTLKNIGKSSILINGNSIAHGQVAPLGSSCLIEISGINFMFEINDRYVRWYVDHIIEKSQEASAHMVNVKPSGLVASSAVSRLNDLKGNEKTHEKRKGCCIHVQYYRRRKRIKDDLFNSPDLCIFEKCNNFLDHDTLNNEAQVCDEMFSDSLANKLRCEETENIPDKGDSANSSTVTEDDILCSLNTEDAMNGILDSQLLDSPANVIEDPLCKAYAFSLLVATPRTKCHAEAKNPSLHVDQQGVCLWEADVLATSKSHLDSVEPSEGIFICILNTEDSEIPCNDEIFLQTHPSPSVTPQINTDIIDQLSSSADEKDGGQGPSAEKYPAPSFTQSQVVGPDLSSELDSAQPHVGYTFRCGLFSRLDDSKGNKKTHEKRKGASIRIQYYRKRKRIFNFPATIRSFATTDVDRLRYYLTGSFDPSFELKDDSANSSPVTEGDILCSLNTEETMDDIPDSQWLNFPENALEDSLCNADGTTLLAATPRIECDKESKDSSFHGDQQNVCHLEADLALTPITHPDSVQISDGKVSCIFNTEDSEIPCYDNISMYIHQSSVRPQISTDSIDPFSSAVYYGFDSAQDPFSSADLYYEFDSAPPHFGQPDKITNPMLIEDRVLAGDGLDTSATYSDMSLRTEVESLEIIYSKSVDNYLSISEDNNSDSHDDLPCFSDIEALIHRIDLEYAEELYTGEVGRHQYNYSKRMISRLEQTSPSSLPGTMSSLGALAVFYRRHYIYYIKKTEVTIGRSTKDTDVDIDLRKVGHANMISRRQGTIKMEIDGSFTLKNLGKSSISVNGNSVAHGQAAALSSSCVIEISGMKFIFEINERHVRRYLDNVMKENQGVSTTFEWSPED